MESDTYWDHLDGSASEAQSYTNTAYLSSSENTVDTYLGDNNYFKIPYLADRNAISPNGDDFLDNLSGIYTGLLRNAKTLHYTITGENGEVYYDNTAEYVGKSIYSYSYYQITPAGVGGEEGTRYRPLVRHRQERHEPAQQYQGHREDRGHPALCGSCLQQPEILLGVPHHRGHRAARGQESEGHGG